MSASLAATSARAVYVNGDGTGQALIYPYYAATANLGWNTYLSVVNHSVDTKVIRVRFREGRNGREVMSYNLYLAPNDVWTGAVLPSVTTEGARFITIDSSCTNPGVTFPVGDDFRNAAFSGANSDGLGEGLDRTREGYLEMIEMATLTGEPAAAAVPVVENGRCSELQGTNLSFTGFVQPPTGGLSGTLTLIQITTGMDFTVNATALADLTTLPFYRNIGDPYPDFNAAEVRPVTHMTADGTSYKLDWTRGVDAVSAALMSSEVLNEYVRDRGTLSQTDWVLTFPTRRFYAAGEAPFAPLTPEQRGRNVEITWYNRDTYVNSPGGACGFGGTFCLPPTALSAASILPIVSDEMSASPVLGSQNILPHMSGINPIFPAGWASLALSPEDFKLTTTDSFARDLATGDSRSGRFVVGGLPVVGFMMRTFRNGLLLCSDFGAPTNGCQGNYGGAFPHRYRRSIEPVTIGP